MRNHVLIDITIVCVFAKPTSTVDYMAMSKIECVTIFCNSFAAFILAPLQLRCPAYECVCAFSNFANGENIFQENSDISVCRRWRQTKNIFDG